MEQMKRVPLRKFMVSIPWRRLFSYRLLLQVPSNLFRNSVVLCRSYKPWEASTTVSASEPKAQKKQMCLQDAVNKVSHVNDNIAKTVSEVKQRYRMTKTTATNGPEGTVSKKTQVSLNLVEQGMRRLPNSITLITKDFLEDVELCTVLTTLTC